MHLSRASTRELDVEILMSRHPLEPPIKGDYAALVFERGNFSQGQHLLAAGTLRPESTNSYKIKEWSKKYAIPSF